MCVWIYFMLSKLWCRCCY